MFASSHCQAATGLVKPSSSTITLRVESCGLARSNTQVTVDPTFTTIGGLKVVAMLRLELLPPIKLTYGDESEEISDPDSTWISQLSLREGGCVMAQGSENEQSHRTENVSTNIEDHGGLESHIEGNTDEEDCEVGVDVFFLSRVCSQHLRLETTGA